MESDWRKSSYSGDNGGECVEVGAAGAVLVRDTTDRNGTCSPSPLTPGEASPRRSDKDACPLRAHTRGALAKRESTPFAFTRGESFQTRLGVSIKPSSPTGRVPERAGCQHVGTGGTCVMLTDEARAAKPPEATTFDRSYPGTIDQIRRMRADMATVAGNCPAVDDLVLLASEPGHERRIPQPIGPPGTVFHRPGSALPR